MNQLPDEPHPPPLPPPASSSHPRWGVVLLIVVSAVVLTAIGSYWVLRTYVFAREFQPVTLNASEEQALGNKLRTLGIHTGRESTPDAEGSLAEQHSGHLQPEPYSEQGARREVILSEREINALLAKNTNLSHRLAIDLSENLISGKLLVPLEDDVPVLGGKTLRFHAGLELAYTGSRPHVVFKGVSIMGIPVPNAWLGNLKNIDLIEEFGSERGFWKTFSDGVEHIHVEEGVVKIKLKE